IGRQYFSLRRIPRTRGQGIHGATGYRSPPVTESNVNQQWLDQVAWNEDGLIPAVAQDAGDGRVLMVAWMNREALAATVARGEAVYYSRSRGKLWHKGEESGHTQKVREVRLDCD